MVAKMANTGVAAMWRHVVEISNENQQAVWRRKAQYRQSQREMRGMNN
jgi:hypothetical protein